jgi:hypothetical protein
MTFFTIVVRGLLRRPVRTGLTLVGISIGIAAVVALVGISRGFEASWATGMKVRGTDIVVSNMGNALAPKPFSSEVRDRIALLARSAAFLNRHANQDILRRPKILNLHVFDTELVQRATDPIQVSGLRVTHLHQRTTGEFHR